jgi:cell division protein FtsB
MTQNEPVRNGREKAKRGWSFLERFLTLVVALLGVGTAYLGYLTATANHDKNAAQSSASDKATELINAQQENERLKMTVADLQQQLANRQTDPGTVPLGAAGTVRHRGTLTLAMSQQADLDAPAADPQWDSTGHNDLWFQTDLMTTSFAKMLDLQGTTATYDTCRNTTGYGESSINGADLTAGMNLCIETSENRFTAMKLTQVAKTSVTLEVTTFNS